ncbi:MAG: transketolase, partial [Deltaproteobacteria bacterium]|nr:transketolase [Deltaproteobacteria bacterium]
MAIAAQEYMPSRIDDLCVNTLRFLSVDAVEKAGSGHPGLPLGASPMAYILWTHYLRHNPKNPKWFDRDRFVLSAGHGSMLLYSLLYLTGYDLPIEQIKRFRQWGSMTPGHPESGLTPGVDVTTGPLGQGFGSGVGMAIAEAHLAARFNRPGIDIINHHTYGILSDGDMMEGVSSEAASLAGHLRLGKLIYLYDYNRTSLSASTAITFTEDTFRRFESYGWHTQFVDDGNNLWAMDQALRMAHEEASRPSLVIVNTHIGYGSPKQDSFEAHGVPLGPENVRAAKKRLGWLVDSEFLVPEEAKAHMRRAVEQGRQAEEEWGRRFEEYKSRFPGEAAELGRFINKEMPEGWDSGIPWFQAGEMMATRKASGLVMNALAQRLPALFGGSADVNPSTHTALEGLGDFSPPDRGEQQGTAGGGVSYAGRNIFFGVREHCMGTVLNGIAAHGGLMPFGATFLIFSDYMRPPMRLAALSGRNVVYVFTHDSIGLGEDGPTHQP